MNKVYVERQGATVNRSGNLLRVVFKGQDIERIPIAELEQLILMGNVQVTTQAMTLLCANNVDVIFLSRFGTFKYSGCRSESRQAERRFKQYQLLADEARTLAIAREIVKGKINNQRVLLQRRVRTDPRLKALVDRMRDMLLRAESAVDFDQLRGFEGQAAKLYFEGLRSYFGPDWNFQTRAYHPPPDPANALLSFVYMRLMRDVEAQIQIVGLDPYLGFFHALGYDRPGLALDLMEEFRPAIADVVIFGLLRNDGITPQDFEFTNRAEQPVRMKPEVMKRVTLAYEARLLERVFHPASGPGATGGQVEYRYAIELQVREMARVVSNEGGVYRPLMLQ